MGEHQIIIVEEQDIEAEQRYDLWLKNLLQECYPTQYWRFVPFRDVRHLNIYFSQWKVN